MSNNMTEAGRKAAEIKAQKRAQALRENLRRRKVSETERGEKGDRNAGPQDSR